ncbi:MAG: hypothetical protein ACLQVG_25925 [Terriglobia bacterium]
MKLAIPMVLLLALCPMRAALGPESGSPKVSVLYGEPFVGAQEATQPTNAAQKGENRELTNDDVISMVKSGLAEDTIVLSIQHSSTHFDTSPQALIALQSQGVPQKVLDAMITAGNKGNTPPAQPSAQTPANPENIGEKGKWDLSEEVSSADGSRTVMMTRAAEEGGSASAGPYRDTRLYIRCQSRHTDVYIRTASIPSSADANGQYSVRLRLDDGQPFTQHWDQSINHDSLFAPQPVELAQKLAFARKMTLEYTPSGSGPVATSFDLNGLDGGLGKVADACGWSIQSPTAKAARLKESTPDIHKIRKVFLDSDWADDDEAVARKARAIETHTCLQVVATTEAADAILSWSIQGFTGGALQLRNKDGQVIWSRSGSLATPLKALKQELGCPK